MIETDEQALAVLQQNHNRAMFVNAYAYGTPTQHDVAEALAYLRARLDGRVVVTDAMVERAWDKQFDDTFMDVALYRETVRDMLTAALGDGGEAS